MLEQLHSFLFFGTDLLEIEVKRLKLAIIGLVVLRTNSENVADPTEQVCLFFGFMQIEIFPF